jgi:thioredoxin-like negative regulator of GroEL
MGWEKGLLLNASRVVSLAGRRRARFTVLGLLTWAVAVLAASGCDNSNVRVINNEAEFRALIDTADKPVLVDFFKGGCASCMFLDGTINSLGDEYKGRVIVARFELMRFWLEIRSMPLWKEYRVGLYPTVVLIVNGKEQKRWAMDYGIDNYRKVLDEVAGPPSEKPVATGGTAPANLATAKPQAAATAALPGVGGM